MNKKFLKAFASSFMAATMLTTTVATVVPMSVSAGDMLGQSTFDEGVGLPWHTCETNPAKQTFEIADGGYTTKIVNNDGPESRWDLQLRHRGLKIQAGHSYKIHWEVTASTAGQMYTKIGDYSGEKEVWHNDMGSNGKDFNMSWDCVPISSGKNTFDAEFTASESLEVAEWAFHYGGKGDHQPVDCFPNGTTLTFDNLTLECTTCGDASGEGCNFDKSNEFGVITPHSNIRLNQVGYFENTNKKATYVTDATSPLKFTIIDATGAEVYTGNTVVLGDDENSGEHCHLIDFSDFTKGGSGYTIKVDETVEPYVNKAGTSYDLTVSHPFNIANTVYDGMLKNALNYYYQNRSGVDIEAAYITSGDTSTLAHEKGHDPDKAYVQSEWVKFYAGDFSDGDKTYQIDGTGGWYDAGDHGKYVVNGGISVWTLQNMYEYAKATGNGDKFNDGVTMSIPEQTNGAPDILDEAKYEIEWMMKMIVDSADPYWGSKYEGMVYHKLHDHKWTGLATKPYDYVEYWGTERIVKPPTTAATLNLCAVAAQAARLWKGIDDTFANKCLEVAKSTYAAAKANPEVYAPLDQAIGGGAYGDTYVEDDFYWAECELYATTGDQTYYDALSKYANKDANDKAFSITTNLSGGENNGSFSSFNWGCTAGLGTLTLYLSDKTAEADKAKIETAIANAADDYLDQMSQEAMGIPYKGTTFQDSVNIGEGIDVTGYEWGSNSFVVNNSMVMAYAYNSTGDTKYINGVSEAMDYIFGRNGLGFSYVTGYGTYHSQNPHHRYWSYEIDKTFPMAPAGVMSGGPGAGMQDPYIGGLGYKRGTLANQKCFVDSAEAWSVNEVTINWNAPFAWVISFLEDEAPEIGETPDKTDPTTKPSETTETTGNETTETTEGTTKPEYTGNKDALLYGDVDVNGAIELADLTALSKFLLNGTIFPLKGESGNDAELAVEQSDTKYDGAITSADSSLLAEYILEKIDASAMGPKN